MALARSERPTLRDVAHEAKLSVTQTSRALNGHDDVAQATVDRVRAIAAKIGYEPNLAARRLKMPDTRSHSIGIVLSGLTVRFSDPFLGEMLRWMVEEAAEGGYELQLTTALAEEDPLGVYERAIKQKRVDGFVILRVALDDPRVGYLQEVGVPFVSFGRVPGRHGFPVVDEGDRAMWPLVDLLVELGHRRIACITEPLAFSKANYRLRSVEQGLARHGLGLDPVRVIEAEYHEESGYEAAARLLAAAEPPTAILAFNDLLALGALRWAADAGVRVPDDLSVAGFDDIDAARLATPPLTTLHQPTELVGRALIRSLIRAIEGDAAPEDFLVLPELIRRESTASPAG